MNRFVTLTTFQLFLLTLFIGLIAGGLVVLNSTWRDYNLLPQVMVNPANECIKVVNFENGHAFTCNDRDVLLRRYRVVSTTN